jgi:hypothetical protein
VPVEVTASAYGPLADGAAPKVISEWRRAVVRELARRGVAELKAFPMDGTGRARGGFQDSLQEKVSNFTATIPGPMREGVAWAPWLEGTSKRNESTGFGGYRLFAKTAARLDELAAEVGEDELEKLVPELGGD